MNSPGWNRMNSPGWNRAWIMKVVGLLIGSPCLTGCHLAANPVTDQFAAQASVTTPSVVAARAVEVEPTVLQRPYTITTVKPVDGTVTHGPLYFEDAYDRPGNEDGSFAWTGEDYLAWFSGGGRFLVNTALFPISAVVAPPWKLVSSDGRYDRIVPGTEAHDSATN